MLGSCTVLKFIHFSVVQLPAVFISMNRAWRKEATRSKQINTNFLS